MADFNPKTIKGNIGGVYFTKTKEAVDPFNLTKYNPNTNQNIILFYLEDGVENNIVTVNFAPNDSSMPKKGWTSHDFPAIFRGYVDHTVNGEAIPRTFAQYLALVPTLITDLNLNNKNPLSFNATVIQQSGVNLLGSFNTLNDLINAHTPTESLHDNDAIAYVYENGQNGFYKVYFSSASSTWYWGVYQGAISTSLSEVQYNLMGLQVQGGFRNPAPIVPLQDEQYRIIWQHLNELYAQYSVIEDELGDLEQEIIELNTAVVKSISKTDTNTIIIGLTRIDNNVNIHAVVNVSSNSYNLLKVVGSDGLEVNPEDIINEIIFEINNTNSALRQAIDDIVDGKIAAHNTNSEAHQDIRNDIETAEQNANEYTDEEVIRVEQKVDTHIEDLNNPHGVTAEQVDTYTKLVIDNKDTAIMNKVNNLENANMFKDIHYNNVNGVLTFTKYDNTTKEIDLPLELLVESGYYDEVTNELVLVLANSSEIKIPVGNLLTDLDAHNIRFNGSGTNYLTTKTEVESAVKELDTRVKTNADDKVDKVTGKGLSTNDFTNNDKNKLDGIEAGAEVNPYSKTQLDNMFGDKVDKNANITAGTHPKITYDEKGLVTGGEALAASDIPNLSPTKITQDASNRFVTDVEKAYWDGKVDADGLEWANILNKPNFATVATSGAYADLTGKPNLDLKLDKNFTALPTQGGPLLTDVLVINRGTVAQKTTLGNLLAQVDSEIFIVAATLPTTGVANKIYLVPKTSPESDNSYDEFIWKDNTWEMLGNVKLDLSGYYNKSEVDGLLSAKVNANNPIVAGTSPKITYDAKGLVTGGETLVASDIPNLDAGKITTGTFADARIPTLAISKVTNLQSSLDNKVDKTVGKGLSSNDFTDVLKNKLDGIEAGAEVNPYSKTQLDNMFGDKVDKNANITAGTHPKITYDEKGLVTGGEALAASDIPNLSPTKITQDASNRFVTDVEKAYWDGKVDADGLEWANILNKPNFATVATSGAYADLTGKPNLDLKLDKNFSALPTQASPLLTDVLVINRGTVAQKTTLGNLLAQVDAEIFIVTATLPATGVVNKIYLVPKGTPEAQNTYDEFIWVNSAWENLGTIALDLSNYYNKTEVNGLLSAKVDKNNAITAGTKAKITYDSKGLVTSGSDLEESDIPTLSASKITQDASNRFVTDAEKAYWDGKQEALPTITQAEINAGTSTTEVVITPKLLRDNFYTETEIDTMIGDIESALDAILGV